ncbi:MAG: TIM barrel protein [Lachnospiraceae bacterium]|nr:TIM barrel protein [Lachnospiraceae bacterium]
MIQSMNLPLADEFAEPFGGWDGLRNELHARGIDGVEGIWTGLNEPPDAFPRNLLTGYHLTFFPDWVDFYRDRKDIVRAKFGDDETISMVYWGSRPEDMIEAYRADLRRALSLGADYVVFHVSDVSVEECWTYRWRHTDEEVLDASVEVINTILEGLPEKFELLVENQWWPGFTFTDPAKTDRLLDGIGWSRKGIMLDTGHLMNANPAIRSEADGVRWILDCIEAHGETSKMIRGMHFHQGVSGEYVRTHIGEVPTEIAEGSYTDSFGPNYRHIQQIDRHEPWTDPACVQIIERTQPAYLTHELAAWGRAYLDALDVQLKTIGREPE